MSVTLLHNREGESAGFVAIARDITNRRREARERRHLETKVDRARHLESLAALAGGIAHDYNNLLTAVIANAALALRELPADAPARDKIRRIERAAERGSELSHQLLSYAGEHEPAAQTIHLNELVDALRERLLPVVEERASLELQLHDDLPLIAMDPEQIRQMILHLTANAVESLGAEHGFITLRTSRLIADRAYLADAYVDSALDTGEYVFLEVTDSGMGMDEETLARIFEPRFTTKAGARGMGLAAVLGIVRGHRGTIKVFSEAGRGTTVQILFPTQADEPEPTTSDEEWRGTGMVLAVDDESLVVDVCAAILEAQGFEVLTASSGMEAIDLYRRHREAIRLVLHDSTMPELNGEVVFREIRRLTPRAKVVLMSGYEEQQVMAELGNLGFAGFLQKPFKPDEVIAKVREALA